MANGIRTGDPCGFNKGRSSKFREGSRVRQTPEEGWSTYRPKRCGNNNKDEDNSLKTPNDKNHQASSQKFRQLILYDTESLWIYTYRNEHFKLARRYWKSVHLKHKIQFALISFSSIKGYYTPRWNMKKFW